MKLSYQKNYCTVRQTPCFFQIDDMVVLLCCDPRNFPVMFVSIRLRLEPQPWQSMIVYIL